MSLTSSVGFIIIKSRTSRNDVIDLQNEQIIMKGNSKNIINRVRELIICELLDSAKNENFINHFKNKCDSYEFRNMP